ncbi:MAG: hypothetical protein IJ426_05985 [Clostridia bacterium]|nr:hypothetical protein [Clostridia bacterium]
MVKGVNKTIIEINNTGSKYFDRVILFVNPSHSLVPHSRLEKKAREIIKAAEPGRPVEKRKNRKRFLFLLPAFAAVAAAVLFIIF